MKSDARDAKYGKESWDELWRHRRRFYVYRNVVKIAEEFLGGLPGRRVLEVGCGRGATLLELARKGANVVGLDYSEEAIAVCRKLARESNTANRAEFVNADAQKIPFSEESFDFVFSVGLIEHFEDPTETLSEQYRVLRKGGICLVQVPQRYSFYTFLKKMLIRLGKWPYGKWETQFSDKEISTLVREAGLEPHYVTGYGSFILAAVRHTFAPTLDFGMMWRNGTELAMIRAVKAKTALDICVVARKGIADTTDANTKSAKNQVAR